MTAAMIGSALIGGAASMSAASSASDTADANRQAAMDAADTQWANQQAGMDDYMNFMLGTSPAYAGAATAYGDNQGGIEAAQASLDRWEGTFGSVEDNLADYYNNLDPIKFATQAKQDLQSSMSKSMTQFNETLAASGMQSAGMKAQAMKESAFALAQGNASIDINAEDTVAGMQQEWLDYGKDFGLQANAAVNTAENLDSQIRADISRTNASNQTQANIFNAGATNAYNASLGNAYLNVAQQDDPRVDIFMQNAQDAGASSANYASAGGDLFGTALGLGIDAYGGTTTTAPYGGVDDGWLY